MKYERQFSQLSRHLRQRVRRIHGLRFLHKFLKSGRWLTIYKARRMSCKIANRDRPFHRLQHERSGFKAALNDLHACKLRSILFERVVELERTLLIQFHQRHTGDRLRHRKYPDDGVAVHWYLRLAVRVSESIEINFA